MIERIFHPIGQGAFYTEQHKDFTIVYDCGCLNPSKRSTSVVKQGLKEKTVVDILFISHFDFDHVSHICDLKKHTKIKKVVLPVLHKSEITMLSNLYQLLGYSELAKLVKYPEEYFGKKTVVIRVKPIDNDENIDEVKDTIDINNIDKNQEIRIKSGTKIKNIIDNVDWVYIPCNFEKESREEELEKLFKDEKYSGIDKIQNINDTEEVLKIIEKDVSKTKKDGGKLLREIYDKLKGKINQNSMLVYSGPLSKNINFQKEAYLNEGYLTKPIVYNDRVGCIYSGDSDLNYYALLNDKYKLKNIFKDVWDNIGTIQIPHHGDIKSFDISILNDKSLICPISFGENNSYGHPSTKLKSTILSKDSLPILVTENLSSGYIELIDLNFQNSSLSGWVKRCIYTKKITEISKYYRELSNKIKNAKDENKSKEVYELLIKYKEFKNLCDDNKIDTKDFNKHVTIWF